MTTTAAAPSEAGASRKVPEIKRIHPTSGGRSLSFQEAEERALNGLIFSDTEAARIATHLVKEYEAGHKQIVLWATVRHIKPRARWENCFESSDGLDKFHASFKAYHVQDIPHLLDLKAFLAFMRSNVHREDYTLFGQLVEYLEEYDISWFLTTQPVNAERDPRQLDPNSFLAILGGVFGKRIPYQLEEYCLVVDLLLTKIDRLRALVLAAKEKKAKKKEQQHPLALSLRQHLIGEQSLSHSRSRSLDGDKKVLALLMHEANKSAKKTVSSSSARLDSSNAESDDAGNNSDSDSLGVSSSDSSGSSKRPLDLSPVVDVAVAAVIASQQQQQHVSGTPLLRSTSNSASSVSQKQKQSKFVPILKSRSSSSRSMSSSAQPPNKKQKKSSPSAKQKQKQKEDKD